MAGQSTTPVPAAPRTADSADGKTLLGDFIGQAPGAPPKEQTILGNLIGQTPAHPDSEETLLGEYIAQSPAEQPAGPPPLWLGTARRLPAKGTGGVVKKTLMVFSALGGAGLAATLILGLASWLGQYQLKRKTSEPAVELAESKSPSVVTKPAPDLTPKTELKKSEPKTEPEPKPKPKEEPKAEPEPDDVPSLINRLKDKDDAKRLKAAEQLEKMGRAAKEAIPALTEALKDKHVGVRLVAASALGRLGPVAKSAVGGLIEAVKEDEPAVRSAALAALGKIGPEAKAACPVLVEIVKNPRDANRTEAAEALANIGGGVDAAPLWLGLLNGKDKKLAKIALSALEATGKLKYGLLPALVEALKNESAEVRVYAAKAIGEIGPDARWTTRKLMKAAEDTDEGVRKTAITALGKIGPGADEAVPLLLTCLKDKQVHNVAAEAIVGIGKGAVPDLIAVLKNDNSKRPERLDAATLLGEIGPDAKAAIVELQFVAANDQYPSVQRAAKAALAKIGKKR